MSEPRDLVAVTDAARMLADAVSVDDIKKVIDVATAMALYAKKARMSLDAQNSAAAIRIEAEAKAGDLLAAMARNGQRAGRGNPQMSREGTFEEEGIDEAPSTLEDLGISRKESSRYQAVAAIPPRVRAQYVAASTVAEEEITRVGLTRFAEHESRPNGAAKPAKEAPPTDTSDWTALQGLMEALAVFTANDAARIAATVPQRNRAATARRLRKLGSYLGRIAWTLEGEGVVQ